MRRSSIFTIATALAALLTACSGGGSGAGQDTTQTGDVTVLATDAPYSALDSFTITVTAVELTSAAGSQAVFPPADSPDLKLIVDLLSLHNVTDFWGQASVPAGSYDGISVTYESATAVAGGLAQTVQPDAGTIQVGFSSPITIGGGQARDLLVDYDLADSITDGGPDLVLFDPVLHLEVDPQAAEKADEMLGIVATVDPTAFTLQVDIHAREDEEEGEQEDDDTDDLGSKLGTLCVNASIDTVLRDIDGNLHDLSEEPGAFDLLAPDQFVRLEGTLEDGCLEATRIQIYDPDDEVGLESFRATVLAADPSGDAGYLFTMRVEKTSHGDLLEEGDEVSVTADATTPVYAEDGTPVLLENVVAGVWLDVEADVVTRDPPALAARVMELRPGELEGEITVVNVELDTLTVVTEGDDEGDGSGSQTLTVFVAGAELSLDGLVPLVFGDLAVGMRVEIEGTIDAYDPSAFVAVTVQVGAENLDGSDPSDADIDSASFKMLVSGDEVQVDTDTVTLLVEVQDGARLTIKDDASDGDGRDQQPTLADLLDFLTQNPQARVEVEGLYRGGDTHLFWATEVEAEADGGKD